jgi:hypothetical protein
MARRATLRASDADRDQIAERLRKATAEGRLLAEELEERLEATFGARTYGELDAVVADLPGVTAVRRRERPRPPALNPVNVIALLILAPVIMSLMLAAAVIVAMVFSAWGALLIVGWLLFGRGNRACWGPARHYRRSLHAASQWPARRAPRPWI